MAFAFRSVQWIVILQLLCIHLFLQRLMNLCKTVKTAQFRAGRILIGLVSFESYQPDWLVNKIVNFHPC